MSEKNSFFKKITSSNVVKNEEIKTKITTKTVTTSERHFSSSFVSSSNGNNSLDFDAKATSLLSKGADKNGASGNLFYSFNRFSEGPSNSTPSNLTRASFGGTSSTKFVPSYKPVYQRSSTGYQSPLLNTSISGTSSNGGSNMDRKYSAPSVSNPNTPSAATKTSFLPLQTHLHQSVSLPAMINNSEDYDLRKQAYVIIFNQEKFPKNSQIENRTGSEKDVQRLKALFKKYNVKLDIYRDKNLKDIKKIMKDLKNKNFTSFSCVMLVFMTHGHRKDILWAQADDFDLNDQLVEPLASNETLKGKPKLFIIQACKGSFNMEYDAVPFRETRANKNDIFIAYSTFEGHVSIRDPNTGSFFIQELCNAIETYGNLPFGEVMKAVRQQFNEKKYPQSPTDQSNLLKNFHINRLRKLS